MEINVAEIFWFVWLTFPPVGLHLIDYLLIVLNLIFWIFWSREKKRNWNVETIFDCQLNTQPSCHPVTIMQRAPNVMMMANWSLLNSIVHHHFRDEFYERSIDPSINQVGISCENLVQSSKFYCGLLWYVIIFLNQ